MGASLSAPALTDELVELYGRFVSFPQAVEITTVSRRTLERLIEAGDLPVYRIGRARTYRLRTEDVAGLIQRVA